MLKPCFGNIILYMLAKSMLFAVIYGLFIAGYSITESSFNSDSMCWGAICIVPYLLLNLLLFSYPLYYSFKVSLAYALWMRFVMLFVEFVILSVFAELSTSLVNSFVSVVAFLFAFCISCRQGKLYVGTQKEDEEDNQNWRSLCIRDSYERKD